MRQRRCENQFAKTGVQLQTAYTFPESHAKFITINHQTKLVSIFKRSTELEYNVCDLPKSHQEDIYGLTKSAKHRQNVILTRGKWWLEEMRPFAVPPDPPSEIILPARKIEFESWKHGKILNFRRKKRGIFRPKRIFSKHFGPIHLAVFFLVCVESYCVFQPCTSRFHSV